MLMFSTPEIIYGKHHIFCILMEVLAYKLVYLLDVKLKKSQKLDLKLLIPHSLNIFAIKPNLIIWYIAFCDLTLLLFAYFCSF